MDDLTSIKKILIIRTDTLGDMLTITPALKNLCHFFPQAKIKALVNSQIGKEVLEHQPGLDEIYVFPKKKPYGLKDLWELIIWMRQERFDLLLAFASRDDRITILSCLSGAKRKIGFNLGLLSRGTYRPAVFKDQGRHDVERNLEIIRALGFEPINEDLVFKITQEEEISVDLLWRKLQIPSQVIGIHPRSQRLANNWTKFPTLIEKLTNLYQVPIVLTGSMKDFEEVKKIENQVKTRTYNIAGQTTIGELAASIKRFMLYITVDSGPAHLAAALKIPQIVLYGAGKISKWYPWGNKEQSRIVYKEVGCQPCSLLECESMKCMQSIVVDDVLEEVAELWRR